MSNPQSLPVSETFVSVQGEGKLAGLPSWFVRASGCNLRCAWCDTPYASWQPDGHRRSLNDLLDEAQRVTQHTGVRHAVLTGGEPLMFPAIAPLADRLRDLGLHVTIETAGTLTGDEASAAAGDADTSSRRPLADLISISPKLSNSTPRSGYTGGSGSTDSKRSTDSTGLTVRGLNPTARHAGPDHAGPDHAGPDHAAQQRAAAIADRHERDRLRPAVIRTLIDRAPACQLKFVVTPGTEAASLAALTRELAEIDALLSSIGPVPASDVLLMPEGVAMRTPDALRPIVDACLARGWRYTPRLHIELFGNRRGT